MAGAFGTSGGGGDTFPTALRKTENQTMQTKFLLKAYAAGVTSADAILNTIMPRDGTLVAIIATTTTTVSSAVAEAVQWEFSLQSTSQFTTTDAANVIATVGDTAPSATAGLASRRTFVLTGFAIKLQAGSRVYVHRAIATAPAGAVLNAVYVFE